MEELFSSLISLVGPTITDNTEQKDAVQVIFILENVEVYHSY